MQATAAAPAAPALPTPQAPTTAIVVAPSVAPAVAGVPRTVAEVINLRATRKELSNQLENVAARRARLSSSLAGKDGSNRAGIEARINVLDKRMLQLEADLAETGHQLALAPGTLVAAAEENQFTGGMNPDSIAALGGVFMIFVLAPIAFAAARMMWKRTNRPVQQAMSDDASKRLERLEQGMDAIAIEIERVSEGQRFVTRLLSEGHAVPALPASQRGEEAESIQQTRT
jgi:hypothetical protein